MQYTAIFAGRPTILASTRIHWPHDPSRGVDRHFCPPHPGPTATDDRSERQQGVVRSYLRAQRFPTAPRYVEATRPDMCCAAICPRDGKITRALRGTFRALQPVRGGIHRASLFFSGHLGSVDHAPSRQLPRVGGAPRKRRPRPSSPPPRLSPKPLSWPPEHIIHTPTRPRVRKKNNQTTLGCNI